jgi:ABC-2 type transport system ATP-binding protein
MNSNHNNIKSVAVRNLTVKFDEFTAVDDITFEVGKGEIFGFLGANGAGKTTTIRVLCGLIIPNSGSATVAGIEVLDNPMGVKGKVGYMSQKFTLYDDMTVYENLLFTASLRKLDRTFFSKRVDYLFDLINFKENRKSLIKDLPTGVLQQIALTSAILHDPEIVFLDEPTAGVTPGSRAKFWDLIKRLAEGGKTVFVTTHYMDEAEQCERIALMRTGKIIALNTPAGLKRETFKNPLYELTPPLDAGHTWLEKLKKENFIEAIDAWGMRYHARVSDIKAFDSYAGESLKNFSVKKIVPSLEDVFIKLVEGESR